MNRNYLMGGVAYAPDPPPAPPPPPSPPSPPPPPAPGAFSFDKFPEPIKAKMTARGITPDAIGFEKLATSFHAADNYLGGARDIVPVPGDKATPDDWNKLYTTLGRPEKAENYAFNLGAGVTADPSFTPFAKNLLFEMGVPASRAQGVVDAYQRYVGERQTAEINAGNLEIEKLKTTQGAAFDQNLARGKQVIQTLGLSAEQISRIEKILAEPGKDVGAAAVLSLFTELGKRVAEGTFKTGGSGGDNANDPANMTPEQATAAITQKQGDAAFMKKYTDKNHPEHAAALKEMEALFAAKHKSAPKAA